MMTTSLWGIKWPTLSRAVTVCCRGCLPLLFYHSVAAFFDLIGEEWVKLFSEVRTREFQYVKPDKRLLLDVAQVRQTQQCIALSDCHQHP
jgi:hypothetical protein